MNVPGRFILLRREKKEKIREIARRNFVEYGAEDGGQKAIEACKKEIRTSGIIATILIGLAIRLAIELIIWWIKNRIKVPPFTYQESEPQ